MRTAVGKMTDEKGKTKGKIRTKERFEGQREGGVTDKKKRREKRQ